MEPVNFHAIGIEEVAWPGLVHVRTCPDCGATMACPETQWTPCPNPACTTAVWVACVGMVQRPKEQE